MMKWEKTKYVADIVILGVCGIGIIAASSVAQISRVQDALVAICFIGLAVVKVFSFRIRKEQRGGKGRKKKAIPEVKDHRPDPDSAESTASGFTPDKGKSIHDEETDAKGRA
jgi:hypothetical protein